jgi:hypothetical protein
VLCALLTLCAKILASVRKHGGSQLCILAARTTLLLLVAALAGEELLKRAYAHAVAERYRFYSYGDAMLVV